LAITLAMDFVELDQLRNGGRAGSPPRLIGVKPRMILPRFELMRGQNASDASIGCISLPIIKLLAPVSPSPHTPCSPLVARERSLFTPSLELCTWPQETLDRRIVAPSLDGAVSHLSLDQGFPDSADA
jgi:hypothetical protein